MFLMTQLNREKKIAALIEQLHSEDEKAEQYYLRPSVAAKRKAEADVIAGKELQLIASGELSPFAAALRQHRDRQHNRLSRRPSLWAAAEAASRSVDASLSTLR